MIQLETIPMFELLNSIEKNFRSSDDIFGLDECKTVASIKELFTTWSSRFNRSPKVW